MIGVWLFIFHGELLKQNMKCLDILKIKTFSNWYLHVCQKFSTVNMNHLYLFRAALFEWSCLTIILHYFSRLLKVFSLSLIGLWCTTLNNVNM